MQRIVRGTLWLFIGILAASALLTLVGIGYLWFYQSGESKLIDLPYLGWLAGLTIGETVGIAILVARRGLRYLPEVLTKKDAQETDVFMKSLLGAGSSATIVSNRLGWLVSSEALRAHVVKLVEGGTSVEIITPRELPSEVRRQLGGAGVTFFVTGEDAVPEARFTLVNGGRSGAERLAIARGAHPMHEITIFDATSGPQIIAMAKDIIRKSKRLASAK